MSRQMLAVLVFLAGLLMALRCEARGSFSTAPNTLDGRVVVTAKDQDRQSVCPLAREIRSPYDLGTARYHTYSRAELLRLFSRSKTIRQLLENLKLAMERDLFVQPGFLDDSVVERVFNTSKAALMRETASTEPQESQISIAFQSREFPGMKFKLAQGKLRHAGYCMTPDQYLLGHTRTIASLTIAVERRSESCCRFSQDRVWSTFTRRTGYWSG